MLQQQEAPISVCRAASVRTTTHKLIFRTDPTDADHDSELYDLVADPKELTNLYGNPTSVTVQAELKNQLFLWYMQTSDVTPWLEDPRQGKWNPPADGYEQRRAAFFDVGADTVERPGRVLYHDDAVFSGSL